MNVYLFIYIILLLLSLLEYKFQFFEKKSVIVKVVFIIFILLGGLRWFTGTDWYSYYNLFIYNNTFSDFNSESFELLFLIYNFVLKSLFDNYTVYLIVTSAVLFLCWYKFLKEVVPANFIVFSILLYYSFNVDDINFVRQNISRAIGVFSLVYAFRGDFIKFALLACVAVMFHSTSIVFLFLYPIINKQFSFRFLIGLLLLGIILNYYGIAQSILEELTGFNGIEIINQKAESYSTLGDEYDEGMGNANSSQMFMFALIKKMIFVPFFLYFRNKINSKYYDGILNLTFVGYFIYFITSDMLFIARMSASYISCEFLLFVFILNHLYNESNRKLILGVFLLFSLYGLFKMESNIGRFPKEYRPYYSIFEDIPNERISNL